jgi:hypothetical protein
MRLASPLVLASALLLSPPAPAEPRPNCNESCKVLITVSAGCGSGIKVAPDPIVVASGKEADITWEIVADGWTFDGPGIDIYQPGKAFSKGMASGSKKLTIKNYNRKAAVYKYDVVLKDKDGTCRLDPIIINH